MSFIAPNGNGAKSLCFRRVPNCVRQIVDATHAKNVSEGNTNKNKKINKIQIHARFVGVRKIIKLLALLEKMYVC